MVMRIEYFESDAGISADGIYRYWLSRQFAYRGRLTSTVLFVGLNPSTADEKTDDATIRRCVGFAHKWGYDKFLMGNLYAFRAKNPNDLDTALDPYGPENKDYLQHMVDLADLVVAAWGSRKLHCYPDTLARWILSLEKTKCLGITKFGAPRHPLYLRADSELISVAQGSPSWAACRRLTTEHVSELPVGRCAAAWKG